MLHALLMAAARRRKGFNPFRFTGPGAKDLIAGDVGSGYFGEIPATDLIDGAALATAVGLTQGTAHNTMINWLKFMHKGKTLFMPKSTLRYSLSWDHLYNAGIVYGTDGPGPYHGSQGPVNQNKILVIKGNAYIVRLIKGGDAIPATQNGGEVNDLLFKLWESDPSGTFWTRQTPTQLGFGGNGQYNICQEPVLSPEGHVLRRIASTNASLKDAFLTVPKTGVNTSHGWRPVLELIPNDLYTFAIEKVQSLGGTPTLLTPAGLEGTGIETLVAMRAITPQADSPLIVGDIQGQPFESALAPRFVIGGANEPLVSIADIQGITV